MSDYQEQSSIPNINLDSSKSSDVYEINFNVILVIIAVIVIAVVGFLFWKSSSVKTSEEAPSPTPVAEVTLAPTSTPTTTPTPTSTSKPKTTVTPKADETVSPSPTVKQSVKIQILNGTGVTGDAGFLKTKLISAGFSSGNITTGNAPETSESAKTEITYYSTFPSSLKIDVTSLLNELYASVSATNSTDTSKYDAVVTTGKKK